ncbi:MAG: glycosyltransferase [Planctomycetes bacterium]|nr:glycosyltransferase [Planctomycetota bacterium]
MSTQRSFYRRLVPHGSRRDRCLWITLVTIRKLREGPGPWLRAVKKGLYQLLPVSLQRRLLRWTGQDEFFARREVRHGGPAGGVETPGLVSVVLPIFEHADLAAEAVASVLAQTHSQLELIVVDDGSTDGLLDVLRPLLADPRLRVVTQPNQGLPKALSTGFEHATGEFFTWTSADNRMLPHQLERLLTFLRARPEVAMVYADYELIDARGERLVGGEFRVMDRRDPANPSIVRVNRSTHDLNRYEDNFIGACFLYRGAVGRLLGDYNPELGLEDYDYWMRINRLFRIEHLGSDEVLYQYRVHDNTLSARARELRIAERAKLLMGYERQRAAWWQAPFFVLADEPGRRWLAALLEAGDTLLPWPASGPTTTKTLAVLTPTTLATLPLDAPSPQLGFACWFTTPAEVYAARAQLAALPIVAFAADADTAARLLVFTRTVCCGRPDADTLALARRHAANHTFFRSTRDAARLCRAVPMPIAAAGPERILLQVDRWGRGGLERVVEDLAAEFVAAGIQVGLLTLDGDAAAATLPAAVTRLTLPRHDAASYTQLLRAGGWQAVHAHASPFGAEQAQALGVPFVQVVHNSYVWFDRDEVERHRRADAGTAAYACVSAEALGYADLRLSLDVQKMLVIENGIADAPPPPPGARATTRARFGFAADDFVFVMVASLQPAKAHLVALRALATLRHTAPHARLLCVGNDRMHPLHAAAVRGERNRLGLDDAVVLAGHVDDLAACYAAADAFLLPSFWEGCSLAVWEAIRHGLPLVLSDVGAAREQLRHGHGELVAPPFASLFDLDAHNLDAVTRAPAAAFAERTAAAMQQVMRLPRRPGQLPTVARRATMAHRHLLLLRWLRQHGTVPGMRASLARSAAPEEPAAPAPA